MEPFRRRVELAAPPNEVWTALTRAELLARWFGAEVELEQRPGGGARFRMPDGSQRTAVVEVVEPPLLLVLRFHPFERDPQGVVRQRAGGRIRFLLTQTDSGTLLDVEDSTSSPLELTGVTR